MHKKFESSLIPLTRWKHPWPTIGGLRHLVAHAKEKNFEHVVVRAGGRVLIDEDAFFEWAYSSQKK